MKEKREFSDKRKIFRQDKIRGQLPLPSATTLLETARFTRIMYKGVKLLST